MIASQRCALLLLVCSPLAPAVAGPPQKAQKQLAKATDQAVEQLADQLSAQQKLLDAALDVVDVKLKSGSAGTFDVSTVFSALVDFQTAVADLIDDARDVLFGAFQTPINELSTAGIGADDLPAGFYFGDGGTADAYRARVLKEVDKTLKQAEKRVRKTGALFESEVGASLTVRLAHPRNLLEYPLAAGATLTPLMLTIDVLLATSVLDATGDGTVYLAGQTYGADGALDLSWIYSGGPQASTTVTPSGDRWTRELSSVPEGAAVFKLNVPGYIAGGAYGAIGIH